MPELQLVSCQHCDETGKCTSGKHKNSCDACVIAYIKGFSPLTTEKEFYGLKCSVCGGLGQDEPTTYKWHNRFLPFLTAGFVGTAVFLILVFGLLEAFGIGKHFDKILVFTTTLIGSITGYYYGGEKVKSLTEAVSPKKGKTEVPSSEGGTQPQQNGQPQV